MIRVIQLALLLGLASLLPRPVLTQTAPVLPSVQWHPVEESRWKSDLSRIPEGTSAIDPQKIYSLPELIDIAETHNPETRVVWERAKQQAAQLGIARSALYPFSFARTLQSSNQPYLFSIQFWISEAGKRVSTRLRPIYLPRTFYSTKLISGSSFRSLLPITSC